MNERLNDHCRIQAALALALVGHSGIADDEAAHEFAEELIASLMTASDSIEMPAVLTNG